jgi:ABC-2 type transport system permease protein
MAMTSLGRSLTFGLSAAMAWFPADNLVIVIMLLGYRLTRNDFWRNITAYFLGPNLNVMPKVILPAHLTQAVGADSIGMAPNVTVDATHTLLVTLVYALVFLVHSLSLTWKRDVKE